MSSSDIISKETVKSTSTKKDKSNKKRKASTVVEATDTESIISKVEPTSEDDAPESTKSAKPKKEKKDKPSKKRKSIALEEPTTESPPSPSSPNPLEPSSKKRKASSVPELEVDINAPEPPSKKALRLLKKGKTLPPSKSGAESSPEPVAKKPDAEKRSEHGVWIGNLPWSVSQEVLRTFLVDHSDITPAMITRVHMPGPQDSKPANKVVEKRFGKVEHNKGFAYVDFSTAEGAEWAVELSEQLLSGRRLLIKNHKSFEGRPLKTKEETRKEGKPASKRIFLGNLSYDVTEEMLSEHFEKCGAVESVKVATFEDSGKCKGYAWIVFEELEAAQNAVRGWVHVEEEASDDESEDSSSEANSDSGSGSGDENSKPVKIKTGIKKPKLRKWYLNKLKGRPLRMEFAEGADVRYKKRYGKDGTKNPNHNNKAGDEDTQDRKPAATYSVPTKGVEYDRPYGAPRLTGGIVKSEGKKMTF